MPAPVLTTRQALAAIALAAAQSVDGVVAGDAGPTRSFVTLAGPARLPGVLAVARQDGRIDLSLQLISQVLPLHPLADRVRSAVRSAARERGLDGTLGAVDVRFSDVIHPLLTGSAA